MKNKGENQERRIWYFHFFFPITSGLLFLWPSYFNFLFFFPTSLFHICFSSVPLLFLTPFFHSVCSSIFSFDSSYCILPSHSVLFLFSLFAHLYFLNFLSPFSRFSFSINPLFLPVTYSTISLDFWLNYLSLVLYMCCFGDGMFSTRAVFL